MTHILGEICIVFYSQPRGNSYLYTIRIWNKCQFWGQWQAHCIHPVLKAIWGQSRQNLRVCKFEYSISIWIQQGNQLTKEQGRDEKKIKCKHMEKVVYLGHSLFVFEGFYYGSMKSIQLIDDIDIVIIDHALFLYVD